MLGRLLNLPFKVLGRAARTVQERNDAAVQAQHGKGDESDSFDFLGELPRVELPEDFDPASVHRSAAKVRSTAKDRTVFFVDMRDADAFAAGHAPDALHAPGGELNVRIAEIPPDVSIVVYADTPERARHGALFCRDRGFEDAWALEGGLAAWKKAGGAIESD